MIAARGLLDADRYPTGGTHNDIVSAVLQHGAGCCAVGMQVEIPASLAEARRTRRFNGNQRWSADHTIAVQILLETGLDRLQRRIRCRCRSDGVGNIIAVAVGVPDSVLIAAGKLPGDLISAGRLFRRNRLPGRRHDCNTIVFERRRRATCAEVEIAPLGSQAGRPQRFNEGGSGYAHEVTGGKLEIAGDIDREVGDLIAVSVALDNGDTERAVEIVVQLSGSATEARSPNEDELIVACPYC